MIVVEFGKGSSIVNALSRQQALSGETEAVDGSELPPANPFRPIAVCSQSLPLFKSVILCTFHLQVVADEAERREKAAKEARKAQRPSMTTPEENTVNVTTGIQGEGTYTHGHVMVIQ